MAFYTLYHFIICDYKYMVEEHKDQIALFHLPPYSPEYNPDELVNSNLKRAVGQKASPHSKDELEHIAPPIKPCQNQAA